VNGLDGVVTKSFEAVGISSSTDSFTISDGDNLPADVGGVTAAVTTVVAVVIESNGVNHSLSSFVRNLEHSVSSLCNSEHCQLFIHTTLKHVQGLHT
jgi:hypothetical protein